MITSGHNFAHVTTDVLSWHVQNYTLMWSSESSLEQNEYYKISVMRSWCPCKTGTCPFTKIVTTPRPYNQDYILEWKL